MFRSSSSLARIEPLNSCKILASLTHCYVCDKYNVFDVSHSHDMCVMLKMKSLPTRKYAQ